jgi:Tfp pilus assembly protein PilF
LVTFKNRQVLLVCLLLGVAAVVAFRQLIQCDFVTYDDPAYVTENIHVRHGITIDAIRWAFTAYYASNWHPLTWMSHMLDIQLFGLNPHRHHLINLLFHIANTILLFYVFHRMTKAPWKSAFVAALFALHPFHVESVAWVAERKDVLSTFFWMLTTAAYVHYVERPSVARYSAVFMFLVLGLMSKPMLVTLPFVLLLLDYWPLQRLDLGTQGRGDTGTDKKRSREQAPLSATEKKKKQMKKPTALPISTSGVAASSRPHVPVSVPIRPLLVEKIPLLALSALSCIVTFIAQQRGGAVRSIRTLPVSSRIANAFVSYTDYVFKTICPNKLAVFYPHPGACPFWQAAGAALLFLTITVTVVLTAERYRYLLTGWLWYAGTLIPVIGIVQVGSQARADRYTYIPLIGLFIMAAWGIPELLATWRHRKAALTASAALTLSCFFIITCNQTSYWLNSFTLFDHAVNVTNNNYCAFFNRGNAYRAINDYEHAIMDYNRAIECYPGFADAFNDRGNAFSKLGNFEQAVNDYDMAIRILPECAEAYNNRGFAYRRLGNHAQAINDFSRAIDLNPEYAVAYYGRGNSYYNLGDLRQAVLDYDKAVGIDPECADAYTHRGLAYSKLGEGEKAVEDLKKAEKLGSKEARDLLSNRGITW